VEATPPPSRQVARSSFRSPSRSIPTSTDPQVRSSSQSISSDHDRRRHTQLAGRDRDQRSRRVPGPVHEPLGLTSEGLKESSIPADTHQGIGFGLGGIVEDLLGLGEDKWWERLLDRWEHLPDRVRTWIARGSIGILVVGVFLLLNLLMGLPVG
jgi:hypothetical protein